MSLKPINDETLGKFGPQLEECAGDMAKRIGALVQKQVTQDKASFKYGPFEDFFKRKKKGLVSKITWEGKEGTIIFFASFELAVALVAYTANKSSEDLEKLLATDAGERTFTGHYQKVSSHFLKSLNKHFAAHIDSNIKLELSATEVMPEDGSKNKAVAGNLKYVIMGFALKLDDSPAMPLNILISDGIVKDVYHAEFAEQSEAEDGEAVGIDLSEGFDHVMAQDAMDEDYPALEISQTVGDAYDLMVKKNRDSVAVIDNEQIVRVVTRNDIDMIRSVFADIPSQKSRIEMLMNKSLSKVNESQKIVTVFQEDSLKNVVKKIVRHKIHSIPVVGPAGNYMGMIHSRMILKGLSAD
ncbi:MAG: CBS domain-containing protein [Deltaproteobacteria bacterium]|nr:CBS domain-containing protein [Deltaproteobacteria bacterium]